MPPKSQFMRNLPNYLTMMRMVAVPMLVLVMLSIWPDYPSLREIQWEMRWWNAWWIELLNITNPKGAYNEYLSFTAAMIFIIASMTDMLDGYLARKWEVVSKLGSLLDPLADKLMVMSVMVIEILRVLRFISTLLLPTPAPRATPLWRYSPNRPLIE